MEFTTPPLPIGHLTTTGVPGSGGTLRRGHRGIVPPPDVTHHTAHTAKHDLHGSPAPPSQNGGALANLSGLSQVSQSTPKQPQGILKDPKRNQMQQPGQHNNVQILSVQNAPASLGASLLVPAYDPATHNLNTFNASMGYTDADGHLV